MNKSKIFKNKKAIMGEAIYWIFRIIVLVFIVGAVVAFKVLTIDKFTRTYNLENKIIINRLLYSPTGLTYFDEDLERAYPGIIDIDKFNTTNLNSSLLKPEAQALSIKLSLQSLDEQFFKEIYYDEESYNLMKPLVRLERFFNIDETRYVLLKSKDWQGLKQATLHIDLVTGTRLYQ